VGLKRLMVSGSAWTCVFVSLFSLWLASAHAGEQKADTVLRNGKIYTADSTRSIREAIALTGNSIVAVGDDDTVASLIGPATSMASRPSDQSPYGATMDTLCGSTAAASSC
jgi:hypothetical protein